MIDKFLELDSSAFDQLFHLCASFSKIIRSDGFGYLGCTVLLLLLSTRVTQDQRRLVTGLVRFCDNSLARFRGWGRYVDREQKRIRASWIGLRRQGEIRTLNSRRCGFDQLYFMLAWMSHGIRQSQIPLAPLPGCARFCPWV